jgi:hypothetical protein
MNIKEHILTLLEQKEYEGLVRLEASKKRILTCLISLSYDKKTRISWRAIEAIGILTGELAGTDGETVRHTAERLLWMIRDESGGIGWSSPEILGEIVRNSPRLCADIAPLIISFHEEPPLRAGVIRAAGRIGKRSIEMAEYAIPIITLYLQNTDSAVRGYAAWTLGELGATDSIKKIEELSNDGDFISFYEDGELKNKCIGEIASEAVKKLNSIKE